MELRADNIIDREIEGHYGFFPIAEHISTRLHQHDFFEIFLINKGQIHHHINGQSFLLTAGNLVFIRPDDAHYFSQHETFDCELLNIAFLQTTCHDLFQYFAIDMQQAELPTTTILASTELKSLTAQLKQWGRNLYRDKNQSRLMLRSTLAQLLSEYFLASSFTGMTAPPLWLQQVCEQMRSKENILEGRDALLRLANRTPEYVGRSFKAHLGITPSQFINDLRLDYASDLLLHTDLSPTDICFDVGFGNLSHFYHLFKARWHVSPNVFRKQNQQTLLPYE